MPTSPAKASVPSNPPKSPPKPPRSPAKTHQLKEDLHLSSSSDDEDFNTTSVPTKPTPINLPRTSSHHVDLDIEGVFSSEEESDTEREVIPAKKACLSSETEKAVASILPPPTPLPTTSETGGPTVSKQSTALEEPAPAAKPTPSASKSNPAPPNPTRPYKRKRPNTCRGIARQSALHDEDAYMARVTQREAQLALLDRYNNAKTTIKRLSQEKEEAEEKAAAINTIKAENVRLRTQRGNDVEAIAKLTAESAVLNSRLKVSSSHNRELEEKLRLLQAENDHLKRSQAGQADRHILHIPCISGTIPVRPEVNVEGAPLSVCFSDEARGVMCHHIALQRTTEGRVTATSLTVQKRTIPDEIIASAQQGR